jgi:hypothetical protein
VARTFAWSRLQDLTEVAGDGAFSEIEIEALWERVKPLGFRTQ